MRDPFPSLSFSMMKIAATLASIIIIIGFVYANWLFHAYGYNWRLTAQSHFPTWDSANISANKLPRIKAYDLDESAIKKLRGDFGLDSYLALEPNSTDYERLKNILKWSASRWPYDGDNDPETSDPIAILEAAKKGEKFRCVEFAEVTVAAAKSAGLPARVLKLRRSDAETSEVGAGHVVAEVWLRDLKKWVYIDAQFGVIPEINGSPLSVTEFIAALKNQKHFVFFDTGKTNFARWLYPRWVGPYLYFVQYDLDQRFDRKERDLDRVVLTPQSIAPPHLFQKRPIAGHAFSTANPALFESPPSME